MNPPFDFRPLVAAAVMFLLLAGAYHLALRWPTPAINPTAPRLMRWPAAALTAPPAAADTIPATEPETPCPPQPRRFSGGRRLVLHRYVGTVGGQPATAFLQWYHPDSITGSFYLHQRGPEYSLGSLPSRRGRLRLGVGNDYDYQAGTGEWHLTGRPGPVLRGTWHDTTGHHPIALRESYTGAVPAELRTLWLHGGEPRTHTPQGCAVPGYLKQYLFLPAPAAVAPALRRFLHSSPATHRRQMLRELESSDERTTIIYQLVINDFQLLGYRVLHFGKYAVDEHGDYWTDSFLFDLVSGRALTLESQLRPDYDQPLQRLLRQHLLHDSRFAAVNEAHQEAWLWLDDADPAGSLPGLPEHSQNDDTQGRFLTATGLECRYPASQMYADNLHRGDVIVRIPYAELRPLVRPGTPLARMLAARGI